MNDKGITYDGEISEERPKADWKPKFCSKEDTTIKEVDGQQAVFDIVNNIALARSDEGERKIINMYVYRENQSRYQLYDSLYFE